MKHAMIEKSTKEQLERAEEHAIWLLEAIACATQDRRFLRDEPQCDNFLCEAILSNGKIAALHAIHGHTY